MRVREVSESFEVIDGRKSTMIVVVPPLNLVAKLTRGLVNENDDENLI